MLNEKKATAFRLASRHILLSIPTYYVARRRLKRKILMCPIVMLTFRQCRVGVKWEGVDTGEEA